MKISSSRKGSSANPAPIGASRCEGLVFGLHSENATAHSPNKTHQSIAATFEKNLETDSVGVVRVDYKHEDPLAVFRSCVEFGLYTATAIAEALGGSTGHV